MPIKIDLRRDGSERIPYDFAEYPVYAHGSGRLGNFQNMKVACHWHDDWELIYVLEGSMGYFVNGEHVVLQQEQGIFVNSRCMHYNYSVNGGDARYLIVLLHPSAFGRHETIRERYIEPLIEQRGMPYRVFDRSSVMSILPAMKSIVECVERDDPAAGLMVMQHGFQILERLYRDMTAIPESTAVTDPRLDALHSMIGFVQNRYAEEIALADIAAAGRVSKSSCCSIFRQYLQQTPVGYLTSYRLERSADLLRGTNLSITDIAMRTGFASQSYFTETFRRHSGVTPTQYRKQKGS